MENTRYVLDDFPKMDKFFRRNLINSLAGFKSINLVGTHNSQGINNLAIFSQVFHVGATPALMGMIFRPDSVPRHTLSNIETTGFYTCNHIHEDIYKQAHQTSARYNISEFDAVGLTPEYGDVVQAPYVKEARIKIGLKFEERHDLKINGTILIIGSVVEIILPKDCVGKDGMIFLEKAGSITGSGLDSYHRTEKIARLSYAKPDQNLEEID